MSLTPEQRKTACLRVAAINESVEELDRLPATTTKASRLERFKARSLLLRERNSLIGSLTEDDDSIGGKPSQN